VDQQISANNTLMVSATRFNRDAIEDAGVGKFQISASRAVPPWVNTNQTVQVHGHAGGSARPRSKRNSISILFGPVVRGHAETSFGAGAASARGIHTGGGAQTGNSVRTRKKQLRDFRINTSITQGRQSSGIFGIRGPRRDGRQCVAAKIFRRNIHRFAGGTCACTKLDRPLSKRTLRLQQLGDTPPEQIRALGGGASQFKHQRRGIRRSRASQVGSRSFSSGDDLARSRPETSR